MCVHVCVHVRVCACDVIKMAAGGHMVTARDQSNCLSVRKRHLPFSVATIIVIHDISQYINSRYYTIQCLRIVIVLLAPSGSTLVLCRRYWCDHGQEDLLSDTRVTPLT